MSRGKIENGRYWELGWQLVDGCTPCSPGCEHCWSAALAHRFQRSHRWEPLIKGQYTNDKGQFEGRIVVRPGRLDIPRKRKKPTVYAVWNDLFHERVSIGFIDDALEIMSMCKQHTFLILTKRALLIEDKIYSPTTDNHCRYLGGGDYLPNVYWGLTVCNQQEADEKIPIFLQVPGKKFLSLEPLISQVDLRNFKFDAVILGGETLGNKPGREMNILWAKRIVDQCDAANVPVFVKQIHINGNLVKDISLFPEKLRRRDLPWVRIKQEEERWAKSSHKHQTIKSKMQLENYG